MKHISSIHRNVLWCVYNLGSSGFMIFSASEQTILRTSLKYPLTISPEC